jgi:FtsP/CotA-like multicopper oxidase with cupredoxin domain
MLISPLLLTIAAAAAPMPVQNNGNQHAAGRLAGTVLSIDLVAATGNWRPNGPSGPALEVAAFGENGGDLSVPGPLIRGREGTDVVVTIRNALSSDLRVFGFCTRPAPCDPVALPAGASQQIRFSLTAPGTYYYWAASSAATVGSRPRFESQLGGAIVVDPREGAAPDRVMVISVFQDGRPVGLCANPQPDAVFAINGASWPFTERLEYRARETVRWRVVNLSCDQHAMHLHGFHFTIDATGDGTTDRALPPELRRTEVTEAIPPGRTFALSWTPTRAGNWLFHCHMVVHMTAPASTMHGAHDTANAGMAGLVMGIQVTDTTAPSTLATVPKQRFSLVLSQEPNRYGNRPGYRMDVEGADVQRLDPGPVPGPVIVVHRGELAEITVINRMSEPTAIHWHGIEIESYFDGVPGFGGSAGNISPPVEPGQSFVVRMTPPRAGTYIYHTHWHDESQLAGGMYGALLVLEPGERYDPDTDHVVVIGLNGVLKEGEREPFALNGRNIPAAIRMRAGVPNRLRLINITPNNVAITAFLVDQSDVVRWTPVAKDGASLPPPQREPRPARQQVSVGETYDFEIRPTRPQNLWLELRRGNGEWVLQAPVEIR